MNKKKELELTKKAIKHYLSDKQLTDKDVERLAKKIMKYTSVVDEA